jgi:hypothetical protein
MKQPPNGQEIIILGSGLGGLMAGTLLAQNKHRVLLVKEKGYLPSYTVKGFHFSPFSNFSEKQINHNLLKRIFQTLDFPLLGGHLEAANQEKIISRKLNHKATFQVILPKARIDIFHQRFLDEMEWKREFPKELPKIEEFYNELDHIGHILPQLFPSHQRSFIKKMFLFDAHLKERVDEKLLPFSLDFKKFIQLQLISRGNLYSDRFPISLAAHILSDEINQSNLNIQLEKLESEVLKQYLGVGGKIEEIKRVKKINLERRKEFNLSLEGDPREFHSNFLIFNSPLHRISSLVDKKGKKLIKWAEHIKPLHVMIPLFLGIRGKVIPFGMKDLLISILDLEKPFQDGNVLFISLSPKGDETQAPEGRRALTVESLMELNKWEQTFPVDYQKGVMEHLGHLFPFLEEHIEFMDFQWANENIPKWSYPHYFYETASVFNWREGVVPVDISKRIYFIGKENFPYLGLEGEILSGWIVAKQILKKYGIEINMA